MTENLIITCKKNLLMIYNLILFFFTYVWLVKLPKSEWEGKGAKTMKRFILYLWLNCIFLPRINSPILCQVLIYICSFLEYIVVAAKKANIEKK